MYLKKEHFFNIDIDTLELETKRYELERITNNVMMLKFDEGFKYKIQYVDTIIVFRDDASKRMLLNSWGWQTTTTKKYINKYLPHGYRLFQKNFEWFIEQPNGEVIDYIDWMQINY